MTAPNITWDFINKLQANGATSEQVAAAETAGRLTGPIGGIIGAGGKLLWFREQVKNRGPWDFKNGVYARYKTSGVTVCGQHYEYDMPGNFHYGFVGAACGIALGTLERAAGGAQRRAGTSKPEYECTHDDDPRDYMFLQLGFRLYQRNGLNVDDSNLRTVLGEFVRITCNGSEQVFH